MPERRLVKERSRSSKARCGTAALAIFPVEGKSCCCQCGGSCVSEGVDAKVSFVRKSELQSLGLSVRIGLDLPNMQAVENGRIEPTLADAARCPNYRNAQNADFAKFEERSLRVFAETFWSNRYWELAGYAFDLICCSAEISRLLQVALIAKSGDGHCPELVFAILQSRSTCRSNQSSSSAS
ncbi:hypothetical protein CLV75_2825 [Ruegeria conchae]|uniref:Uncharacterized protein n=1 Tax=Ruegeria conchae TaxID=981384 RepID=A0A497ZEP2_9RHOB|nr:hypothetical protein CLV75_2825 [Ruegeria conchae]